MSKSLGTVVVFCCMAGIAQAQARAQADVNIRAITAAMTAERFMCRVEVHNDNDDNARATSLRILLPVGVRFVSSERCTIAPTHTSDRTQGLALCDLGDMRVGAVQNVEVTTTAPPSYVTPTCGALVWSLSPDPRPANNCGEATAIAVPSARREAPPVGMEISGYAPAGCLTKGRAVTINGVGFGDAQGTRRAVLGGGGISVPLTVSRWLAGSISATIPNDPRIRSGEHYYIGIQRRQLDQQHQSQLRGLPLAARYQIPGTRDQLAVPIVHGSGLWFRSQA